MPKVLEGLFSLIATSRRDRTNDVVHDLGRLKEVVEAEHRPHRAGASPGTPGGIN
jgi:hypothetical protein